MLKRPASGVANPPTTPGPVVRSPLLFPTTKPHDDKCDKLTRSLCPAPSRAGLRNISRHKASLTVNRTFHTTTNPLSPSTLDAQVGRRRIQPLPLLLAYIINARDFHLPSRCICSPYTPSAANRVATRFFPSATRTVPGLYRYFRP